MFEKADADWQTIRRESARRRIVDAAWRQAETVGVGALSLRALARGLGMTAPSLYSYFPSKDALFDAMYTEAWQALDAHMERIDLTAAAPAVRLETVVRAYLRFCNDSLARYELMSRRPVPGWEPSPTAYAVAERSFDLLVDVLADLGVTDPRRVDLFTAVVGGLAAQQMSNDPGGERWLRLSGEATAMFLAHVRTDATQKEETP